MDHVCSQRPDAHPAALFLWAAHSRDRDRHCYCPCLGAISSTKGNHLLCSYKQITHWRVSGGIIHFYHTEAHQGCHSITWKGLQLLWGTSSPAIISISHPSLFCSVPYYKLQVLPTFLLIPTWKKFVWWPQILDHLHKRHGSDCFSTACPVSRKHDRIHVTWHTQLQRQILILI